MLMSFLRNPVCRRNNLTSKRGNQMFIEHLKRDVSTALDIVARCAMVTTLNSKFWKSSLEMVIVPTVKLILKCASLESPVKICG